MTNMTKEQAVALDNDDNWKAMRGEMDRIIQMETEKLIAADSPDMYQRLQERIRALRFVTRLPQIIAEREDESGLADIS